MNKPIAIPTAHKCSVCDLDWQLHGEHPSLDQCVELLKAEVKRLRAPKVSHTEVSKIWPVERGSTWTGKEVKG